MGAGRSSDQIFQRIPVRGSRAETRTITRKSTIMTRYTVREITNHLTQNNSYFKWSCTRLAARYGVSERTMNKIIKNLSGVKETYLRSLN
jgi:AraC-like DNA-binding protein